MTQNKKMSPAWKKKWLKALASGKYKQGKNRLQTEGGEFCCLGVLCDIVDPKKWKKDEAGRFTWKNSDCYPPRSVKRLTGFDQTVVLKDKYSTAEVGSVLTDMNDSGKKFKTIARWIEKNL